MVGSFGIALGCYRMESIRHWLLVVTLYEMVCISMFNQVNSSFHNYVVPELDLCSGTITLFGNF
jgi:hypothetical protein